MCATFLGFALLICLPAALRGQDPQAPCDSPQLEGGSFVIEEGTNSHEQKLFYVCNDGWKLTVEGWWGTASCQNNRWIPTPQCIDENACIAPEVPNAKYRESPNGWYEEGRRMRITCVTGYKLKNNLATTSCVKGNWTTMPVCERDEYACGLPPKVPNAVVVNQVYQPVFDEDSEVEYVCEDGYTTNTGATQTSVCSFGNWTDVSECTREAQPDTGRGGGTTGGDTSAGASTPGGVEEDIGPYISIAKCGTPPRVENGDVVEESLKYLKYQCSAYYTLQGSDTVVCHSDGTWSNPPTCLTNFCAVDTATYEHLENTGTQFLKSGDMQKFRCTDPFRTSHGYCEDGQITFTRCCFRVTHSMGRCQ